jgi:hypothetical protein
MLEKYIPSLVKDLELGNASLAGATPGSYTLPLDEDLAVNMTDIPNGFILKSSIAPLPKTNEELFSTQLMLANLFGQGTKGASLGLSSDGNTITLTRVIDYPVTYKDFREILEDFINCVDFWHDEALNHK